MSIRASLIAALALTLVATAGAAPGNGKIAYVRDGSAFVANSDGSGEVGIATDASALPMWSPDGGHLAYLRRIQHSDGSADFVPVVTAADGSNATQLATQGQFALGCWLDASTLVAVSTYSPPPPQTYPLYNDLYTFSLGGTANRLTSDGGAKLVSAQGCAPDGSAIAFAKQQPDSKLKAFVANRDGSSSRLLTPVGFSDSAPAWSPNGDGLAFARYGVESGLYVSDTSGGGLRRVTTTVGEGVRWSPDSERLLFTRRYTDYTHCSRYGCAVQSELRTIDADGAQERVLGEGEADATQGWSPDGTRIVSTSFNGSIVRNADGTCRTLLPPNVSPTLAWQPLPGQPPAPELTCADLELSADVSFVDLPLSAIGVYTLTVVNQGNRAASAVALDQPPAKEIRLLDAQPS
ncbi:MAG: hypothetical protein ACJ74C_05160, partial [Gaiellaceae bacterium]